MYKAVFIDLDGTLLKPDHSISTETRDTLRWLLSKNILVVLVSARPFHGITPISEWLGTTAMPIVSLNGGYIGLDSKIIFTSSIDPDIATALNVQGKLFNTTMIYYTGLEWYSESTNDHIRKEQRITEVPVIIQPFSSMLQTWKSLDASLNKVMAIGEENRIAALEEKLLSMFPQGMNIYTSKPTYLEIMRGDASKTNAVKFLLQRYGLQQNEILAIGDNFNDLEMIRFAGTGVAMGNAPAVIREAADYVTDTNEQDGVRKAIEHFIGTVS